MAETFNEEPVYVAVSKDVGESKLTLRWALRNLQVKKLYLVHVHQQISMNPTSSGLEQSEIDANNESELNSTYESLLKYRNICLDKGVIEENVDILFNLANNVGEGIVELIYENNIKKLIMGAAADSHYSEGMVDITSRKAKYVSRHAPQCCKIWLVCNGNLIQTRKGRFDLEGSSSSHSSSSESLTSLQGIDSSLTPYEEVRRVVHDTDSHALSSLENQSAIRLERMYYEEQRRILEIEELKREKEQKDKQREEESLSRSTQILYNEEVSRRRKAEEELNKAKEVIENMKIVQKELEEQLKKERDDAVETNQEILSLRLVNMNKSDSWSVSDEPPTYFLCPISKEVMREPRVAADGFTYEAESLREWLDNGHETSPMTNLRLPHNGLVPNLALRSAIQEWLQRNS
ncbi:unnamed protein product [Cochlearia groenlandica]